MKSVVGLYENRQAVGFATDPQLHSNRTVIHYKREYLVQLYYTRSIQKNVFYKIQDSLYAVKGK